MDIISRAGALASELGILFTLKVSSVRGYDRELFRGDFPVDNIYFINNQKNLYCQIPLS